MTQQVSWLELERYALGELPEARAAAVRQALASDPKLQARLADIEAPALLRPLPAELPRRRLNLWWAPALATAVGVMFWMMRPEPIRDPLSGIKGSTASVAVVAQRGAQQLDDVRVFAATDRLKVQLTCGAEGVVQADVVVFQDGVDFLRPAPIETRCGNTVTLPGAFRLDAEGVAEICVLIDPPDGLRARLTSEGSSALPEGTPCRRLAPLDP